MSRIHSQTGSSRPFEPLGAGSQAFREEVCKHALVPVFFDDVKVPRGFRTIQAAIDLQKFNFRMVAINIFYIN